ncbi:hypothetical protein ASPSYDRAFT_52719 [Aspergillus sydowii CBS 593.65]|uniref:Uncharacterized protein n=1 Tax=Aspergillus sydowii CBS 593.65 TaxID=1036612 RepID=A0A1L9SXP0_9EURO|nr:uncharacterized protein ASPSYDRAFT_52719 [Aspergillus sydowii CBS 593.65]OJJ51972.1 hypothetical protein ASPSYDRAFT_52719 [Aspergillus sydowii CBS 593.65]
MAPMNIRRESGLHGKSRIQRLIMEEHLNNLLSQSEDLYLLVRRLPSELRDSSETLEDIIKGAGQIMHMQAEILSRIQELLYELPHLSLQVAGSSSAGQDHPGCGLISS